MNWLVARQKLNTQQAEAARLPVNQHCVIVGGYLTGKTQVLMHRAIHLQELHHVPRVQLRIWTSTAATKRLLKSVAAFLNIDPDQIEQYDDWCERIGRDPAEIERSVGGIGRESLHDLDAYVRVGVTHLIMGVSGPDWDLSLLPELGSWRDAP